MDTGQGKHCENPPRDFLSDVDCEKKRRLSFLKSARDEVNSGLKFQDWRSQRFILFGSLIETLEKKQRVEKMRLVVSELKPRYRRLVELRYFEEYSYDEIALELDLPLGTVKAQLYRARDILASVMEGSKKHL